MMKLPNGNYSWTGCCREQALCSIRFLSESFSAWHTHMYCVVANRSSVTFLPKHAAAFNFRSWKKMQNIMCQNQLGFETHNSLQMEFLIISICCNATYFIRFCWNFYEVILVVEKDFHFLFCCLNKKNKDSQVGDFFVNCACPDFYKWIALNIRNAD